jgi:hypothetical protein
MSTQQVAFYTNRVGKVEKMASDKQTERQTNPEETKLLLIAHLLQIYSHTPTHKLRTTVITAHLRYTVIVYIMYTTRNGPVLERRWGEVGGVEVRSTHTVVYVVCVLYYGDEASKI